MKKNTFAWGLALGTLLLQGVSAGRPAGGRKNPGKPQTGRSTFLAPKLVGPSESIYKGTGPAGKKKYAH
jgi:hypothetical protein